MKLIEFAGKCARIGDRILEKVAILLAVFILLLGGYALWDNYAAEHGAFSRDILKYKPIKDTKSLAELNRLNPDVFAWLTIDKTNIDYPVVQGKDNFQYLNKDPLKEFSISGSIFLDSVNSREMTDSYTILYGHHMSNGGMFGDVVKFINKGYFDKRKYGTLTLLNKKYKIKLFACAKSPASDGVFYNPKLNGSKDMESLLFHIKEKSLQYRDVDVKSDNQIIALSTCSEAETNGRVILFGILLPN